MPRYIFTAAGRTALDNQNIDALSDALGLDGKVDEAGLDAAVTALAEDPASAFAVSQSSTFGRTAYNLRAAAGLDATTDIHALIAAAVAAGHRYIVVPYRAAAWPATTTLTLSGVTLEFEPGARISFDMPDAAGMDLTGCTLIGASFTSIYTGPASADDWPNYGYPARRVTLNDNNRITGGYYHEHATTGLYVSGAHNRVGDTKFANLRHRTGWAEAIHCDGTGSYDNEFWRVEATDCDRACENEDGAHDITYTGGGSLTNIYPDGYTGQPADGSGPDGAAYATYTFVLDAHAHEGSGGVQGIAFEGSWVLTDCGAGVTFIRSTGTTEADMPRACYVEEVRMAGLALAPGYQAVSLQGRSNRVGRVHFTTGSGIAGGLFRVRGYGGSGNVVDSITADSATKNLVRVDNEGGGGLLVGDVPMPALKSHNGKYTALSGWSNATNGALGNNTLRLIPHYVAAPLCIDRIGCEVTVAGEAGCVVRLGIYDDSGGLPGDPIIDATVAADAIGTPAATVFTVLAPGWYWVGGAIQGAPTTQPTLRSTGSQATPGYPILADSAATAIQSSPVAHSKTGVTGALPAFGTTLSGTSAAVRVFVRLV